MKEPGGTLPVGMLPDEALMMQYQAGDVTAFDALYSRHAGRVLGYLLQRISIRARAEEVLQAAFLKLHRSRHLYDPRQPFGPWFFKLLQNVLNDALRSERRNPVRPGAEEATGALENMADPSASPEAAGNAQGASSLLAASLLERLDAPQRKLLELRYLRGLSFDAIAGTLGITAASARQRVSRAVRRLRALSGGQTP